MTPWPACRMALVLGCALALTGPAAAGDDNVYPDSDVKAAILHSFLHFVDWPAGRLPHEGEPLVIGILGETPLRQMAATPGAEVRGHRVAVKLFKHKGALGPCHILFIAPAEEALMRAALARVKGRGTLTVGDHAAFLRLGGMINMITREKIHLEVNLEAVEGEGLTISSKLLRLATVLRPSLQGPPGER
jgi:hypothetical protein